MERVKSKRLAAVEQVKDFLERPAPRLALAGDYGEPQIAFHVGTVPVYYRAKASNMAAYPQVRRYYAGQLQIAYVSMGKDLHVNLLDGVYQSGNHRLASEKALQDLLTKLLTSSQD